MRRLGFLEGAIEGIRLYAIWRNGKQLVGCLEKPIEEVLAPYEEERNRLLLEDLATCKVDGISITCKLCGQTSQNAHDVANRYCGWCHIFHEDLDYD